MAPLIPRDILTIAPKEVRRVFLLVGGLWTLHDGLTTLPPNNFDHVYPRVPIRIGDRLARGPRLRDDRRLLLAFFDLQRENVPGSSGPIFIFADPLPHFRDCVDLHHPLHLLSGLNVTRAQLRLLD